MIAGDLDEVQSFPSSQGQRVFGGHDSELGSLVVDDADLANTDLIVDAQRSCYGKALLESKKMWRRQSIPHGRALLPRLNHCATGSPSGIR